MISRPRAIAAAVGDAVSLAGVLVGAASVPGRVTGAPDAAVLVGGGAPAGVGVAPPQLAVSSAPSAIA
jgi:hypothetical protein